MQKQKQASISSFFAKPAAKPAGEAAAEKENAAKKEEPIKVADKKVTYETREPHVYLRMALASSWQCRLHRGSLRCCCLVGLYSL